MSLRSDRHRNATRASAASVAASAVAAVTVTASAAATAAAAALAKAAAAASSLVASLDVVVNSWGVMQCRLRRCRRCLPPVGRIPGERLERLANDAERRRCSCCHRRRKLHKRL